jgi:hypothetical protein
VILIIQNLKMIYKIGNVSKGGDYKGWSQFILTNKEYSLNSTSLNSDCSTSSSSQFLSHSYLQYSWFFLHSFGPWFPSLGLSLPVHIPLLSSPSLLFIPVFPSFPAMSADVLFSVPLIPESSGIDRFSFP